MKIAVCVKAVPDTETKIVLNNNNIDTNQVKFIISPYDEFALEEALKIKEKNAGSIVSVFSVGGAHAKEVLRDTLARGADEACHIVVENDLVLNSMATSKILGKALEGQDFDIVLTGNQGVGTDNSCVPSMLAYLLNCDLVSMVLELKLSEDKTFEAKREIEGSNEIIKGKLPAIFSAQKGLNEPRYPSIKGVMAARKKEIKTLDLQNMGLNDEIDKTNQLMHIQEMTLPQSRTSAKNLEGDADSQVKELVSLLRHEAKVL